MIDVHERIFPWVTRNEAVAGTEPDRVFSSEVLFASQNRNVGGIV